MSRWIDADALKYYGNHIGDEYEDKYHDAQWVYRSDIDSAPSIDIVRCSECKWSKPTKYGNGKLHCSWHYRSNQADDFCSYGQRAEQIPLMPKSDGSTIPKGKYQAEQTEPCSNCQEFDCYGCEYKQTEPKGDADA